MIPNPNHLMLAAALCAAQVPGLVALNTGPLVPAEHAALRAIEDPALADLSAGLAPVAAGLDDSTREGLRSLETENQDLAEQRAGDLDNNTLMTILIVLAIVALVIIIL
jgi:hypothetical protein